MAGTKKYAGLPDLDDAGTELYQTPGLTDDAGTTQTSTLRTESPIPSETDNEHFDHAKFDRDEARRRFEPAVVDARDVNFSYAIGGARKSYTSKRRRRHRRGDGDEEGSDGSDGERMESVGQKLARLKREAEELKLEIEMREREEGEFQDSFEHQNQHNSGDDENEADMAKGLDGLTKILNGLQTSTRTKHGSLEEEFSRRLDFEGFTQKRLSQPTTTASKDIAMSTNMSAITDFSDRLTAIESALGLSTISPASNPTAILPTLDALTNQVHILHTTIIPNPTPSRQPTTASSSVPPQMPHLDILQSRLHTLHQSASNLLTARKAAQTALTDLENVRLRGIRSADHLARYQTLANRRYTRPAPTHHASDSDTEQQLSQSKPRPTSQTQPRRSTAAEDARERLEIADELVTPLFLEDQAEKIRALYNVLPTIQDLQPLLPVVLERLRALSIVHAGAAEARTDMDDIEARLGQWEIEMGKWRGAVEGVEKGIAEMEVVMKENIGVVGGLVRGVEERIGHLEKGS